MFRVHQQAGKYVPIQLQREEYAQADIVNATFHGPVHGFGIATRTAAVFFCRLLTTIRKSLQYAHIGI
jgi:hypothetical protein